MTTIRAILPALLMVAMFVGACQPNPTHNPAGEGIGRLSGDIDSAIATGDQATQHADPIGVALLKNQHVDLADAKFTTISLEKMLADYERAAKIAEDRHAADLREIDRLDHSWGHRLQVWVTWGFWLIVGLVAFHVIGGLVGAMFAATPWGGALAVAARLVNPAGWFSWIITHASISAIGSKAVAVADAKTQ